jgi:hypothetical protein
LKRIGRGCLCDFDKKIGAAPEWLKVFVEQIFSGSRRMIHKPVGNPDKQGCEHHDKAITDDTMRTATNRQFRSCVEWHAQCSAQTPETDGDVKAAGPQKTSYRQIGDRRSVPAIEGLSGDADGEVENIDHEVAKPF